MALPMVIGSGTTQFQKMRYSGVMLMQSLAPDETVAPEAAVELARIRRSGFVETRHLGSNPQPHT